MQEEEEEEKKESSVCGWAEWQKDRKLITAYFLSDFSNCTTCDICIVNFLGWLTATDFCTEEDVKHSRSFL